MLQEVLDEEDIARDPLHGFDEQVIQAQLPLTVPKFLLHM